MCPLVLAIKTFFSPIFDLPAEKNADEVFTQIGGGKSAILGTLWAAKKALAPFGGGGCAIFVSFFSQTFFPSCHCFVWLKGNPKDLRPFFD